MEILVINGSPKGKHSVTLQTVNYLQILHPEHHFEVLHAGQTIKALEKDFSPAVSAIQKADVLLFSYPVYTFIAPSQLHRFIELLKAANLDLSGKYASQITTSKHFYDMTAHRYIQDNCQDLNLRYIPGLSADMDDLTTKKASRRHGISSGSFAGLFPRIFMNLLPCPTHLQCPRLLQFLSAPPWTSPVMWSLLRTSGKMMPSFKP